jgi:hypothetical protein
MSRRQKKADPNRYPKGLDRARVERVIAYYEGQSEEEAIAEAEAAWENSHVALMRVPTDLVDEVRALITRSRGADRKSSRKSA